jgi:hypothetical protein
MMIRIAATAAAFGGGSRWRSERLCKVAECPAIVSVRASQQVVVVKVVNRQATAPAHFGGRTQGCDEMVRGCCRS